MRTRRLPLRRMLRPVLFAAALSVPGMARAGAVPGDADCDGDIDGADVAAVVVAIFEEDPCPGSDVNGDGRTTAADLSAAVKSLGSAMPTATPVASPMPTATGAPSATPAVTRTGTVGRTATPTWTLRPTRTPTRTTAPTLTRTPSRTSTPANTIPPSPTRTASSAPTATRTASSAPTPTRTPSTAVAATATATATFTPTQANQTEGPLVRFFGVVRANGCFVCDDPQCVCGATPTPTPFVDGQGRQIYQIGISSGFLLVVEAQPGTSGSPVGDFVPAPAPGSPLRPDLQMQSNRNLGDGSREICDTEPPSAGGVPAISPPNFDPPTGDDSDALTDFACRFTALTLNSPCTLDTSGNFSPISPSLPNGSKQFCYLVSTSTSFARGDTILSVRVRDKDGNVGDVKQIVVRRP